MVTNSVMREFYDVFIRVCVRRGVRVRVRAVPGARVGRAAALLPRRAARQGLAVLRKCVWFIYFL